MKQFVIALAALAAVLLVATSAAVDSGLPGSTSCMPMAELTSINFVPSYTTGRRRGPNVPMLQCQGNCPNEARLNGAHCTQQGRSDNGFPSWRCDGNFAPDPVGASSFQLGNVRVQCEGCHQAGDPDIAMSSCALIYSVVVSNRHAVVQRSHRAWAQQGWGNGSDLFLLLLIVLAITVCCTWQCVKRNNSSGRRSPDHDDSGEDSGVPRKTVYGQPMYPGSAAANAQGPNVVHHHYNNGGAGYGYGGGGLSTGMLMGYMMGSAMAAPYGGHSSYDYDGGYSRGGGSDWGGGGYSDGGGYGGSDVV